MSTCLVCQRHIKTHHFSWRWHCRFPPPRPTPSRSLWLLHPSPQLPPPISLFVFQDPSPWVAPMWMKTDRVGSHSQRTRPPRRFCSHLQLFSTCVTAARHPLCCVRTFPLPACRAMVLQPQQEEKSHRRPRLLHPTCVQIQIRIFNGTLIRTQTLIMCH